MSNYKQAAMRKLRFMTKKGLCTVEDLFDLDLQHLDLVAKSINKNLKESAEESFIEEKSSASALLQLELDIVKDVIADKLAAKQAAENKAAAKIKKDKLLAALARKQDEGIDAMSEEEIKKELESL